MDRRSVLARAGALGTALLAGCLGDGDGGGSAPTDTPTRSATPTPTDTVTDSPTPGGQSAQEIYPDYSWEALEGTEPTPTDEVTLRNTAFHPAVAAVHPGTTVTFTNNDGHGHTVTIPALGVNRDLGGGESTTVTFERAGTFDYVCELHPPGMLGRMVVTDSTPTPTTTPTPTDTPADDETPTDTTGGTPTPTDEDTPTPTETSDGGGYY